ncbi:hypothetical protein LZ30DRAFT_827588 [Colletotrichum cereale]|nr:hypothetical protein LZ30DRAFT_827588 [Colletotrichum cereale]
MGLLTNNAERSQRITSLATLNDGYHTDIQKIDLEINGDPEDETKKKEGMKKELLAAIQEIVKSVNGPEHFEVLKKAAENMQTEEEKQKLRDAMSTYAKDEYMVNLIGGLGSILGVNIAIRIVTTGAGRGLLLMLNIAWREGQQVGAAAAGQIIRAIPRNVWQLYRYNLPRQVARGRLASGARFLGRFGLAFGVAIAVTAVFDAIEKPKLIEMIHEANITLLATAHIKAEAEKVSALLYQLLPIAQIELQALAQTGTAKEGLLQAKDIMLKSIEDKKPFEDTTYEHVWDSLRKMDETNKAYMDDDLDKSTAIERAKKLEDETAATVVKQLEENQTVSNDIEKPAGAPGQSLNVIYKLVD